MKIILCLVSLLVLSSCAHRGNAISEKMDDYDYKNHSMLKEKVEKILDNHTEFDAKTIQKLKKITNEALDANQKIKIRESKLAQVLLGLTLKEKASFRDVTKVKTAMKNLYMEKYKVFETAADKMRKIIGIKSQNQPFINEIEPYLHR